MGERFTFNQQGKTKHFSCKRVGFTLDISDLELLELAQQRFLRVYANPPAIVFTEKTLGKPGSEAEATIRPERQTPGPQDKLFQADLFQLYAWLVVCVIAVAASLSLIIVATLQVLNNNVTIGILSGLATIIPAYVTKICFRNYEKANERLRYLRSKSSTERK